MTFGQRVITAYPPNYRQIVARFPWVKLRQGTIFSYADVVYNPHGKAIDPQILAHEAVHGARQAEHGVELWWERYLDDEAFMVAEEVIAHRAEWDAVAQVVASTKRQRNLLNEIAGRLSGPLYGHAMTAAKAKLLIAGAA